MAKHVKIEDSLFGSKELDHLDVCGIVAWLMANGFINITITAECVSGCVPQGNKDGIRRADFICNGDVLFLYEKHGASGKWKASTHSHIDDVKIAIKK